VSCKAVLALLCVADLGQPSLADISVPDETPPRIPLACESQYTTRSRTLRQPARANLAAFQAGCLRASCLTFGEAILDFVWASSAGDAQKGGDYHHDRAIPIKRWQAYRPRPQRERRGDGEAGAGGQGTLCASPGGVRHRCTSASLDRKRSSGQVLAGREECR